MLKHILRKISYRLRKAFYQHPTPIASTLNFSGKTNSAYFKPITSCDIANNLIASILKKGEPALISRLGATELKTVNNYIVQQISNYHGWNSDVLEELFTHSGVFPLGAKSADQFSDIYIDSIRYVDLMGVWDNVGENLILKLLAPNAQLCELKYLEPFFADEPWSKYLENKKVLVIHPFEQTIIAQYQKRQYLFPNPNTLPSFELLTIKAVQSLSAADENFNSWHEALLWMENKIDAKDFDVAIIGAGAYGLPLGAYIKQKGKIAIHLGGVTQMLFGIKGKRWIELKDYKMLFNNNWTYPLESEKPVHANKADGIGPYWK